MHPFVDLSVDPESDPTIEENYDGLPGDFDQSGDFDQYEVIDIYEEDYAL